jgi:hypothetical protein
MTSGRAGDVIKAWTGAGALAGMAIGGVYGTCIIPGLGTIFGGIIGFVGGPVVGLLIGLVLAWIGPSPGDAPLVAEAAMELILLPLQIWLWFVIRSAAFLPVVVAPSVVSVAVAALLARRLPPGGGQPPGGSGQPQAEALCGLIAVVAEGALPCCACRPPGGPPARPEVRPPARRSGRSPARRSALPCLPPGEGAPGALSPLTLPLHQYP